MKTGSSSKFIGNDSYTLMLPEVEKVRDCIAGEFFVKQKGSEYLPHPSSVDKTSPEQRMRYKMFIDNAEFDEFPDSTERVMIGKLKLDDIQIELPQKISYLESDSDGDGLSLNGLAELCCRNALEVKWMFLLADYQGLSDLDVHSLSIQELEQANPRATIKQYTRENILDWSFSRIGGKMQLTYILLRECSIQTDPESMTEEKVYSWLKLAIDDDGYYQQKYVSAVKDGEITEGEKNYPAVNGSTLDYIPGVFASDEEMPVGKLPEKLGFLNSICDLALARYRTNARYKESLDGLQPMINIYGVDDSDWETYKEINKRNYAAVGVSSPNIWPSETTKVEILNSNAAFDPWEREFDKNTKTVRALGGVFKTDITTQRTATEIINESENQLAVLYPMVDSVEEAVKTAIWYCGIFEGIYKPEGDVPEDIIFEMPRDFAATKLSVEEVKALADLFMAGLMPKEELIKIFELGGWTISKTEDLLTQLNEGFM